MNRILLLTISVPLVFLFTAVSAEQATQGSYGRRGYNERAALGTVYEFHNAAFSFRMDGQSNGFWDEGTTDFDRFFKFSPTKNGYIFKYFANGMPGKPHDSTRYIFYAYPDSFDSGRVAYFTDTTDGIFLADIKDAESCKALAEAKPDWSVKAGNPGSLNTVKTITFGMSADRLPDNLFIAEKEMWANEKIKDFCAAARSYSAINAGRYWDDGTDCFYPYPKVLLNSEGYVFRYFGDGKPDEPHDSRRFVIVAYPRCRKHGLTAFFVDETFTLFASTDLNDEQLMLLSSITVDWTAKPGSPKLIKTPAEVKFSVWENLSPAELSARDIMTESEQLSFTQVSLFWWAAVSYSKKSEGNHYWDNGTFSFAPYYRFDSPPRGHAWMYAANGKPGSPDDSTRFIFLVYPKTEKQGDRAFFVTEGNAIFMAIDLDAAKIELLKAAVPDWSKEAENAEVLKIDSAVVFKRIK